MTSPSIVLSAINIYPVKGLAGIPLRHSLMTTRGLKNDRRFMLVDTNNVFVTQRNLPKLTTVWTELIDGQLEFAAPDREPIRVDAEPQFSAGKTSPAVRVWSATVAAQTVSRHADQWLSDYLGMDVRLVYMPDNSERKCNPEFASNGEIVSFADGYPVLITNAASLADLNTRIGLSGGMAVPMNRFRSNLVVSGAANWEEDGWTDLAIGDATFRAVKPCARCEVTTTDQASGEIYSAEPLTTLGTFRHTDQGILFGVNLLPVKLAPIQIGDILNPMQG